MIIALITDPNHKTDEHLASRSGGVLPAEPDRLASERAMDLGDSLRIAALLVQVDDDQAFCAAHILQPTPGPADLDHLAGQYRGKPSSSASSGNIRISVQANS